MGCDGSATAASLAASWLFSIVLLCNMGHGLVISPPEVERSNSTAGKGPGGEPLPGDRGASPRGEGEFKGDGVAKSTIADAGTSPGIGGAEGRRRRRRSETPTPHPQGEEEGESWSPGKSALPPLQPLYHSSSSLSSDAPRSLPLSVQKEEEERGHSAGEAPPTNPNPSPGHQVVADTLQKGGQKEEKEEEDDPLQRFWRRLEDSIWGGGGEKRRRWNQREAAENPSAPASS